MENKECCTARKKLRTTDEKKQLANRLSRIEGQVRGIKKMLEEDAYCVDILTQTSAVMSALGAFSREMLTSHIKTCVVEDIKADKAGAAEELSEIVGRMLK